MRTVLEVKTEIATLMSETETSLTPRQLSRIKNRIKYLQMIQAYLESAPPEEFVKKEIARLENRIVKLWDTFDESQYKDPTEAKKKFDKDMDMPYLRMQLKALRYIKK